MSYNYRFAKLGDFASFKNGINYRRLDTGEKIRIINVKELVSIDFVDDMTDLPIIELEYDKYKNYLIKEDNIIIARSASPGEVILYKGSKPTIYSGFSIKIDFDSNILYPEFLFYYLKFYKNKVINVSNGTIFKNLNQNILNNIEIPIMSYSLQQAIANILSSLDDKIELNNKINKNLEELAQTLYKQWFVDFEFPNENGEPYKSSGGEMVDSELGLIPIGWSYETLGKSKLTKLVRSGIDLFDDKKIYLATADVTDTTITNHNTIITYDEKPSRANMQPKENTVWFAKMKNSRKLIRVSNESKDIVNNYIFSTGFAGLECDKSLNYIWTIISDLQFDDLKNSMATGTTQEAINNGVINNIPLLIPTGDILKKFENITKSIFNLIAKNDNENIKLAEMRDLLLPKLMSGEIRIPLKE